MGYTYLPIVRWRILVCGKDKIPPVSEWNWNCHLLVNDETGWPYEYGTSEAALHDARIARDSYEANLEYYVIKNERLYGGSFQYQKL